MNTYNIDNLEDLKTRAKEGNCKIIITKDIDCTDGIIDILSNSYDNINSYVSEVTSSEYTSYKTLKKDFIKKCTVDTAESNSTYVLKALNLLRKNFRNKILINVGSDVEITSNDTNKIYGAFFLLENSTNVKITNIYFYNTIDPFPLHGKNNGYNSNYDPIQIRKNSKNIVIDKCRFTNTSIIETVSTSDTDSELFKISDGVVDMSGNFQNIVISNCKIYGFDKVSTCGSSDSEEIDCTRNIYYINNTFTNCSSRIPMIRKANATMIGNSFVNCASCVQPRYLANIASINNSFEKCDNAYTGTSSTKDSSKVFDMLNTYINTTNNVKNFTLVDELPF